MSYNIAMEIIYIGLGKMGKGMALLMGEKGHKVYCYNRSELGRTEAREVGLNVFNRVEAVFSAVPGRKIVFIMVSHAGVDEVIAEILPYLKEGDIVIDGGNCFYKETKRRAEKFEEAKVRFLDIGVSGGPGGARSGACLMIGGDKALFGELEPLFKDISAEGSAYAYLGSHGAGHYAKMVHNGIEYGMMQSIAEGFNLLRESEFKYSLTELADLYQKKSVIESRLVEWLRDGFKKYGEDLSGISGEVSASGEGEWTVNTAKEKGVPAESIELALNFRTKSKGNN